MTFGTALTLETLVCPVCTVYMKVGQGGKRGGTGIRGEVQTDWNVWNSWQRNTTPTQPGTVLWFFWRGTLSVLGSTAGFSSSQTPWGTLKHSYGSVSVISLCWHGLKRAREIDGVIDLACLDKWEEIELTVCLVCVHWILRATRISREKWVQAVTVTLYGTLTQVEISSTIPWSHLNL